MRQWRSFVPALVHAQDYFICRAPYFKCRAPPSDKRAEKNERSTVRARPPMAGLRPPAADTTWPEHDAIADLHRQAMQGGDLLDDVNKEDYNLLGLATLKKLMNAPPIKLTSKCPTNDPFPFN